LTTTKEDRERWCREAQMAIDGAQQGRARNKVLARATREIALCCDVDKLVKGLKELIQTCDEGAGFATPNEVDKARAVSEE
jgi:hypothetical protein